MARELRALRDSLRGANLRRLQLAWTATSIAEWGSALVLAVYAYGEGGAGAVGLMALFRFLPGAPAAPFLALLADRRPRRSLLLATNAVRAVATAGIAMAIVGGAPIGIVYALAAVTAVAGTAYAPAQNALLPVVARTPSELSAANVASSMILNLGVLIGSAVGGALLTVISTGAVMGLLAAGFAISIVPLALIEPDQRPEADPDADPVGETLAGFRTISADPQLRELVGMLTALTLVEGAVDVLVVVAALDFLGVGEDGAGYLSSLWGPGAIVGGIAVVALMSRNRLTWGLTLGSVVVGVAIASIGLVPSVAVAAVALFVTGAGYTLVEIAAYTLMQRLAADHVLARVFGVVESLYVASIAVGSVVAGFLVDAVGAKTALVIVGAFLPLVALVRRRQLARFEAGAPVPGREYALLRAHAIFAPLPLATTERLARNLTEVEAEEGEVVIRQGDVGDRVFLIAEGELDAFVDEGYRRTMEAGDCCGEIALLRDVPRTATVRARTDSVLLALDRDSFIEAVTGLRHSTRAAEALAERRMAPIEP